VIGVDGPPPGLPDYPHIGAAEVRAATDRGIAAADRILGEAMGQTGPTDDGAAAVVDGTTLLDRVGDALRAIWTAHGEGGVLSMVHPDGVVREAAEEAGQRMEAWRAAFVRDPRLLEALEGLDEAALADEAATVRRRWIAALRDAGAHLDSATRAKLQSLQATVFELQAKFVANLHGEPAEIIVDRSRLTGLPLPILEGLAAGTEPGTVVVPVELRQTILERVQDRGVREAIQRRWLEAGQVANRDVVRELTAVHRRMARLLGASSWNEHRAAHGMVGSIAVVRRFMEELEPPFLAARDRQLAMIRAPLAAEMGVTADELVLEDWDVPRGLALLRDELGADGAALREYFPLDTVLAGLAQSIERVLGVRVTTVPGQFGWHPDVRRFDLMDAPSGRPIGSILFDPYARPGKAQGVAGMSNPLALGGIDADGKPGLTHAVIVLFIPRPDDGIPALLAPSDIEALFHEFGHALDFMLGKSRFAPIDADGWIRDWSEAPSQSVGRWAALPEVLSTLGRHVTTGEPLPPERAEAFARASELGTALHQLRYLWFARIDAGINGPEPADLDALWREAWAIRGTAPATDRFAAGPLTILNLGYDGVMYGFLWSQAFMEEIVDRFRHEGALSPVVGADYRRELLEPGWAPDPMERMRRFLGRDPSVAPYVARLQR
jgi:Zn-dependent oligopeptidase